MTSKDSNDDSNEPVNLIIEQSSPPNLNADLPEIDQVELVQYKDKILRIVALEGDMQASLPILQELESAMHRLEHGKSVKSGSKPGTSCSKSYLLRNQIEFDLR